MSSEERLGIQQPYDYQCGDIDLMIEKSQEAVNFCKLAMCAVDNQTVVQANKEVFARIEHFEEQLEEFRNAIEQVRYWGDQWKTKAKEVINKHEPETLNPHVLLDVFDLDIPF